MTDINEGPDAAPEVSAEAVAHHPHHNLIHGAAIAIESIISQLEKSIAEEFHDAIESLRIGVVRLRAKL